MSLIPVFLLLKSFIAFALNQVSGRIVAVKRIKLGRLEEGASPAALDEIRTLQGMYHENVITLYDVFSRRLGSQFLLAIHFLLQTFKDPRYLFSPVHASNITNHRFAASLPFPIRCTESTHPSLKPLSRGSDPNCSPDAPTAHLSARSDAHGLGTISLVFDFMETDLDQLISATSTDPNLHVTIDPADAKAWAQARALDG
jgi:serine/threonine protein kinase